MVSIGPYDLSSPPVLWARTLAALEDMEQTPSATDPYRGTIVLPAQSFARWDLRAQHVLQLTREGWLQSSIQSVDGRTLTRWESTPRLRTEQVDLMIGLRRRLQNGGPEPSSPESPSAPPPRSGPGPADTPEATGDDRGGDGWDPDAFDAEVAEQAEGT